MLTYNITITSKNQQALKFLFLLLNKKKGYKFNLIKTYKNKKQKIKKITTLKSPHVNKTAQDQFEYKVVSKQYDLNAYNSSKDLIFLKKLKTQLFPEIKITIKFLLNKEESVATQTELLNPSYFNLNNFFKINQISQKIFNPNTTNRQKIKPCSKIKNYLQIFDCYGELKLSFIKKQFG